MFLPKTSKNITSDSLRYMECDSTQKPRSYLISLWKNPFAYGKAVGIGFFVHVFKFATRMHSSWMRTARSLHVFKFATRMHSSWMRTARSLTTSHSICWGGGGWYACMCRGRACPEGVCMLGEGGEGLHAGEHLRAVIKGQSLYIPFRLEGGMFWGYGPRRYGPRGRQGNNPPPPLWTDWQRPVKTSPSHNLVCGW